MYTSKTAVWPRAHYSIVRAINIVQTTRTMGTNNYTRKQILTATTLAIFAFSISAFAQQFTRITAGPLVNSLGDSRSVNWVDINNDGLLDCMITNGPSGGQNNSLFLNSGGGSFTLLAADTICNDNKPSDGATWADYDNDGYVDCFVANWYNQHNMMYRNSGTTSFLQITTGAPVTNNGYSETASWGDYDNDGLLDLYVTNSFGLKKNFLYHNDGNGVFTRIITGPAVTDQYQSRCVNWTDMDSDGDLDLFVTNEGNEAENIYRNDGAGIFTPVTTGILVNDLGNTMSSSWADYDNDGDLDVFLANDQQNNGLYRNDGNFLFTKISADTVSLSGGNSFCGAWSDTDNDGDLDLFVTNAFWTSQKQIAFYYLNNGNGTFTREGTSVLATDSSWSYGCAFGDYDNDGFEDLAVATVRFNSLDEPDFLYHNNGNANHWLTIYAQGVNTNKSAIGTKIRIKATINGQPVWQMREISAQHGYCGQNDFRAHFGLGDATIIDSIIVEWLGTVTEVYTAINVDQFITITEGNGISAVSVSDNQYQFSVFPNPSMGLFTVRFYKGLSEQGVVLNIIDSSGRLIREIQINSFAEIVEFDLSDQPSGAYIVQLRSNEKILSSIPILKK
jgi:enediyne biosynthesis protein E4